MWFDKQSFTLKSCRGSMYKHNFIEALTEVFQNTSSYGAFGSQYLLRQRHTLIKLIHLQ